MAEKPTYEELAERVKALEKEKKQWLEHGSKVEIGVESDMSEINLGDIINIDEIQSIMDDFCYLTNMVTAVLDLKGRVIEATGWQDICTKFHRKHPGTAGHCTESDLYLAKNLKPGEHVSYKCKNGLWDVVTPLYVGTRHLGNIYTGQFFYEDEKIEEEFFIEQAEKYGFDKEAYLDAFRRIPRYSRETIDRLMSFLVKFTTYVSRISLLNIQLEKENRERLQAQEALRLSKESAEKLIQSANAMIVVVDAEGKIKVFNRAAEEITGYTSRELIDRSWFEVLVPRDRYPEVWEAFIKSPEKGLPCFFENPILTKTGDERFISWRNTELSEGDEFKGSISYGIDITESKRLENQLRQSQKMEAIGQLSGGIAHDFNNMLSVILGHAELVKTGLTTDDPMLKNIQEIENAALHSRDITRQLLAFSRKQVVSPKTVDLNTLISIKKRTLAKLIGENIEIRYFYQKNLWHVRIDPTQVDQILFNLAANSRDSMPRGGIFEIQTSNIDLDEEYCLSNVECSPGNYVLLSVSDTGSGMEKETRSHIFEPFYTTKETGKGTGLGLATVYGIVKQNGGFINVYSELEKGTTFKIHIPRLMDEIEKQPVHEDKSLEFHPASILLVEDDDMVRRMTTAILKRLGYSVLAVEFPEKALALVKEEGVSVDLLVTDVVMPKMSGVELVTEIRKFKPDFKVLFMSGYTENVIVHQGVLKEGVHFLQKPFSMKTLAKKVRKAIEGIEA